MAFGVYVYLKYRRKIKYRYGNLIFATVLLVIFSAVSAYYNFDGQPILLGIRPQRFWLINMLMYFPILKLIKTDVLDKERIFKIIDNVVVIYSVIILVQYFVGTNYRFMYVLSNERYGSIRLYVSSTFLVIAFFYHLNNLLDGKKIRTIDLLAIGAAIFVLLFVAKSRMRIIAFLGASILFICSKRLTKRKILIIALCIIGICAFFSTDMSQDIWNMVTGVGSSINDTSEIRDEGRAFYITANTQSWLRFVFGSGYPNMDWSSSYLLSGAAYNIFYNDNGIIGLFFCYGILFVLWGIKISFKNLYWGIKGNVSFLAYYAIYGLLGSFTLFPCFYVTDISFALLCAITETEYEKQQIMQNLEGLNQYNKSYVTEDD